MSWLRLAISRNLFAGNDRESSDSNSMNEVSHCETKTTNNSVLVNTTLNSIGNGNRNRLRGIRGRFTERNVTQLLEDLIKDGFPLSDTALDLAVEILRPVARNNVFIAKSFIASYLDLNRGRGNRWTSFGRLFRNRRALCKQDDKYFLPIFVTGDSDCGQWYLILVEWNHPGGRGWIFDSLPLPGDTNKQELMEMLNEVFTGTGEMEWMEEKYTKQTELECGSRTAWAIATAICGINKNKSMEEIRQVVFKLEERGRVLSAHHLRHSVHQLLLDFRT